VNESFFLSGEEVEATPYHYKEGGLDGIYLLNGFAVEEHDGEEHVSIVDVPGLHKAIGRHIVLNRKALAPREIRFLRKSMDLTQAELADKLGCNSQSVARWEKGEVSIPGAPEKLLRIVFLCTVITQEEAQQLRKIILERMDELDELDELKAPRAQFSLALHEWGERPPVLMAAHG